jgi:hypothetical protein
MSSEIRKYQPSNGTEGMMFMEQFCDHCLNQHPDPNSPKQCMIICRTMCFSPKDKEYPEEWTYDSQDQPVCTAFVKWDWGKDDDGNWIEPPPPPIDDPNQLCLPFIMDEIGVPKAEEIKIEVE